MTNAPGTTTSHPSIPLVELPPRPEGGYPLEYFDTWPTDPEGYVAHLDAYMRADHDDHSDLFTWHVTRANEQAAARAADAAPTQLVSTRLPEPLVAEADRRATKPEGRSGVIRRALEEFYANHPVAS
jgi:hypothetical protein